MFWPEFPYLAGSSLFFFIFIFTPPCQLLFVCVSGLSISANVPGGIYTDVDRFGAVFTDGPPLYRFNDLNYRWVALNDWHYQLDFNGMSLSHNGLLHTVSL